MVVQVRVLVAYGSTRGGTAGLAHMVADAFTRHHVHSDVRRAGDVTDLSGYDAVVVGGALYNGRWHPDAVGFVGRHRTHLRQLPVWFFSSGPLDDSARSGALAPVGQVTALARETEIRGHMTFGGYLERRPAGLMGWFAWGPEGDFRDPAQVGEWVERIAEDLRRGRPGTVDIAAGERRASVPIPQQTIIFAPAPPKPPAGPLVLPVPDEIVMSDHPAENSADGEAPAPARGRFGLRRYLRLDDEDSDDDGLDLLESAEV